MGIILKHKVLIIMIILALVLINASIFGTLWLIEHLREPTAQELYDLKQAEVKAEQEAIYASFEPLDTKSRIGYLRDIGQAIEICEDRLHSVKASGKSWQVNMIESKYVDVQEKFYIFLRYFTPATPDQAAEAFEVTCEVLAENGNIENWKVLPLEQ